MIGGRPVEVLDLAYDTRRVGDGTLFFCVRERPATGTTSRATPSRPAPALVVERPVDATCRSSSSSVRAAMAVTADTFFGARPSA